MDSTRLNNIVQITTVIALVAGFAVVIWELQQGKDLAYAAILTDEITRFHDRSLALMGEDPREALAKASLEPDSLNEEDAVTLHGFYSTVTMNWAGIRLTAQVGGIDRIPWETTVKSQVSTYMSSPAGRKWLKHWAKNSELADPEVVRVALRAVEETDRDYFGSSLRALLTKDE